MKMSRRGLLRSTAAAFAAPALSALGLASFSVAARADVPQDDPTVAIPVGASARFDGHLKLHLTFAE